MYPIPNKRLAQGVQYVACFIEIMAGIILASENFDGEISALPIRKPVTSLCRWGRFSSDFRLVFHPAGGAAAEELMNVS